MELTARELEIAKLISEEFLNKEIAYKLGISLDTVKNHLRKIREKTGAKNNVGIAKIFLTKSINEKNV